MGYNQRENDRLAMERMDRLQQERAEQRQREMNSAREKKMLGEFESMRIEKETDNIF